MWFHQFLHPGAEQDWLDWQGGERSLWLALNSWLQWCLKSTIFSCNIEILINKEFSIFWKHVLALRHFLPIPFPFYQGLILWLSKWKCLWKKSVLYSFQFSEKIWPRPPFSIVFIGFYFFSRNNRLRCCRPPIYLIILSHLFSLQRVKDELLRSWRLEIEVYSGLAAARRPTFSIIDWLGTLFAFKYFHIYPHFFCQPITSIVNKFKLEKDSGKFQRRASDKTPSTR